MRGDRLRQIRQAMNLSQEELSHALGLGTKEIWRYENGKTEPSADTLAKIATRLGVSSDYLLGLSEQPFSIKASDLTLPEISVIAAWRRGDVIEAARTILNDEKAVSAP